MKVILLAIALTGIIQPPKEHQVKAVFLYNFTQFVDWPESAFSSNDAPLVIGILGHDPFGTYLDETIKGEKKGEHPLVLKRFKTIAEATGCHILYINGYEPAKLKRTLAEVKDQQMLTVSDIPNFAKQGGMIRLYTAEGKIQIRINIDAVKNANLSVSAKLLNLAEIVHTTD